MFCFFFFQAEDGIRDIGVTGVQTCALPISDLVVLDLGLPDLDGSDALRMLRGITDVPVIIATARDDEQTVVRLLRAGADDYMVKPFTGAHLDEIGRAHV